MFQFHVFNKSLIFVCFNLEECFEIKWNKNFIIALFSISVLNKIIVIEFFVLVQRKISSMF